jgi:hypothetical protein
VKFLDEGIELRTKRLDRINQTLHLKINIIFHAFCIIIVTAIPLYADIFSYTDNNGVRHFTNVPTSSKYKLYVRAVAPKNPISAAFGYSTDRYDHLISQASANYGISFPLLKAIIKAESGFNPRAVSKKGALGLMQIMPANIRLLQIKIRLILEKTSWGVLAFLKSSFKVSRVKSTWH